MTGNFQNRLPSLSPQQLEKLGAFLDELMDGPAEQVDGADGTEETKSTPRRQKQRQKNNKASRRNQDVVIESEDIDDLEDDEVPTRTRRNPTRKAKGKQCRIEPVVLSGINRFESMPERNAERKDIEIDKKLWKDRQPTVRSGERFEKVNVRCRECKEVYPVNPNLVYRDPDSGKAKYICDDCVASRR